MECSGQLTLNKFTIDELKALKFDRPDENIRKKVLKNWDLVAKPLDSLGDFENLLAKIAAISRTEKIDISKKAVIIMCADNGIVEEGVSQVGQEVTLAVARAMGEGKSCVGKMAKSIGADTIAVDIGINTKDPIYGLVPKKIRQSTRNFSKLQAMTEEECIRAIASGIDLVFSCKNKGYKILATGELGIGNTTTTSAIASSLLKVDVHKITGRGAGLSDEKLIKKKKIIKNAIEKYDLYNKDPLTILQSVGGFDIAGLVGLCLGACLYHIPLVLDGVISMVAALIAESLFPGVKDYCIPSHRGKEPAVDFLSDKLGLKPVIDANMALGEGTGAVMMFSLLDIALSVYENKTSFDDIKIDKYERLN